MAATVTEIATPTMTAIQMTTDIVEDQIVTPMTDIQMTDTLIDTRRENVIPQIDTLVIDILPVLGLIDILPTGTLLVQIDILPGRTGILPE